MDDTYNVSHPWESESHVSDATEGIWDWPPELVAAFPATHDRCQRKDGHLHDTIKDSTRQRKRRRRPLLTALEQLRDLVGGPLIFCTLELPDFAGRPLYSKTTINAARRKAKRIIQASGSPGIWKLERGVGKLYHLHLVLAADGDVSAVNHWREADDLDGLASYLSKPADAMACKSRPRPDDLTADLQRRQLTASEEFLTTRRSGERYTFHGKVGL